MAHYPNVWIQEDDLRKAVQRFALEESSRLAPKPRRRNRKGLIFVPVWVDNEAVEKEWFLGVVKFSFAGIVAEIFPHQGWYDLVVNYSPNEEYENGRVVPGIRRVDNS